MDEYKRLAARYFDAFEGRRLYPSLRTWHWYALALASTAALYLILYGSTHAAAALGHGRTATIAVMECALAGIVVAIDSFKAKASLKAAQAEFGENCETLDDCRIAALEHITLVERDKFASMAKECSDLLALQKAHRMPEELNGAYYLRKIYDPESKGRLLTIVMGSLALFTAMLMRSLPPDYPSILEVLVDQGVWTFLSIVVTVSVMLFGIWLAGQAMALAAVTKVSIWWARVTGRAQRSDVALRYFLRDLIRFHRPSSTSQPGITPAKTASAISANDDKTSTPPERAERSRAARDQEVEDAA